MNELSQEQLMPPNNPESQDGEKAFTQTVEAWKLYTEKELQLKYGEPIDPAEVAKLVSDYKLVMDGAQPQMRSRQKADYSAFYGEQGQMGKPHEEWIREKVFVLPVDDRVYRLHVSQRELLTLSDNEIYDPNRVQSVSGEMRIDAESFILEQNGDLTQRQVEPGGILWCKPDKGTVITGSRFNTKTISSNGWENLGNAREQIGIISASLTEEQREKAKKEGQRSKNVDEVREADKRLFDMIAAIIKDGGEQYHDSNWYTDHENSKFTQAMNELAEKILAKN